MELIEIQKALKCPKDSKNAILNYNYRTASAILERVKEFTDKPVILSDDLVLIGDRYYIKATAQYGENTAVAFAREPLNKKGMDDSQITGAASTYARKYALCGLFAIDDSQDDPDSKDNSEKKEPAKKVKPKGDPLLFQNWSLLLKDAENLNAVSTLAVKIRENKTLSEGEVSELREIAAKTMAKFKGETK